MNKNIFEIGAKLDDGWESDNRLQSKDSESKEIKSPQKHSLFFAKEKRRGKVVTIVQPFYLSSSDMKTLLKSLKKQLGTGGTIKQDTIELQGDIQDALSNLLIKMGYRLR